MKSEAMERAIEILLSLINQGEDCLTAIFEATGVRGLTDGEIEALETYGSSGSV